MLLRVTNCFEVIASQLLVALLELADVDREKLGKDRRAQLLRAQKASAATFLAFLRPQESWRGSISKPR